MASPGGVGGAAMLVEAALPGALEAVAAGLADGLAAPFATLRGSPCSRSTLWSDRGRLSR